MWTMNCRDQLWTRIESQEARVGVVGMGYVGLPLALAFVRAGFHVTAFDVDPLKVDAINRGESYIQHLNTEDMAAAVKDGMMVATGDFESLSEQDAILICVPTPLTPQREPDMKYVRMTAEEVSAYLRPGQIVVLESTTYPGTTDDLLGRILGESGLVAGEDFLLAYSPEREDPGNQQFTTTAIPKLVGGTTPDAGEVAELLYSKAIASVVCVSSARVAEAAKLTENIFRSVNIALVNELKVVYDRMGIDVWEVLDAAETKPFGFMRFNPGPGWGGHCIPLDPFYLTWKAREYGTPTKFIELAGEVNVNMPDYVIGKVQDVLNRESKPVRAARIAILGIAYKKDVDDCRESPAFHLLDRLLKLGADVCYHDPHVPRIPDMRHWPDIPRLESTPLDQALAADRDLVLIVTDHTSIDYERVLEAGPPIVDTRGVFRAPHPRVTKA